MLEKDIPGSMTYKCEAWRYTRTYYVLVEQNKIKNRMAAGGGARKGGWGEENHVYPLRRQCLKSTEGSKRHTTGKLD